MKKLFTIGYEGAALDDFVHTLQSAKIDVLLDVRELPISRRKGFSKTALGNALTVAGIGYRHEKQLGSPRTIRHRLREDGNYPRFFREFDRHLNEQGALLTLLAHELKGNVALMCYERDHEVCHRRSVADALAELLGKTPIHLGVDDHESLETQGTDHDLRWNQAETVTCTRFSVILPDYLQFPRFGLFDPPVANSAVRRRFAMLSKHDNI